MSLWIWIIFVAAALIAVAIMGVRQAVVGLGTRIATLAAAIASLWLLGLAFYAIPIIIVLLLGFGLLVAAFVLLLKPARRTR